MPEAFLKCIKDGGKVRTIKIGKDKYAPVCFLKGKSYIGEIKTKQSVTAKIVKEM